MLFRYICVPLYRIKDNTFGLTGEGSVITYIGRRHPKPLSDDTFNTGENPPHPHREGGI